MSVAFNRSGAIINSALAGSVGVQTIGTDNGSHIIFRVSGFRKYLIKVLGEPTVDNASPYDDKFKGRKGIIAFSVNWRGATGHIALWNGYTYREPIYDNYSNYVNSSHPSVKTSRGEFWEVL